jgi:hypothetical protein
MSRSSRREKMVRVYYHDNLDSDQRLPHEGDPCELKAVEALGLYTANITAREEVDRIAKEKGYVNRDEVFCPVFASNADGLFS